MREILATARQALFAARAKRPRPHLDDKIITAWNGLMISAFARAAQVFCDAEYLRAATAAAHCLRTHLYDAANQTLVRNYREGRSAVAGFADDYAVV
ncbi:MAG: thioredoxin domain-containing protein, partial [Verrucomicrobiota bacterium]|nr:thioredoxin domain-containing protein [Verrucomicrobiota bacterium]